MKKSYLLSLFIKETYYFLPFLMTIKNRTLKIILDLFFICLLSPMLLYRYFIFTVPYIELVLTSVCNLKCKGCSNLMHMYEKPAGVDIQTLKGSVDKLLSVSGRISLVKLIGGEPFVYKQLPDIVNYIQDNKKIKRIEVITNGSIVPKDEILKCLKHKKITVMISNYPDINNSVFIDALKKENIKYKLVCFDSWLDYGDMQKRNYDINILTRSFRVCSASECKSLYNGLFFNCPRAAHGNYLGLVKNDESDYIDIINIPDIKLKSELKKVYSAEYTNACDHCNPEWEREGIEQGKQ